jgi:hypothetical protein
MIPADESTKPDAEGASQSHGVHATGRGDSMPQEEPEAPEEAADSDEWTEHVETGGEATK